MGIAVRGVTHCSECGKVLGMNIGKCEKCKLKQKGKTDMKTYKGYELIKAIAEGEIKERNKI